MNDKRAAKMPVIIIVSITVLILAIAVLVLMMVHNTSGKNVETIGEAKAKQIALRHADLKADDVTFTKAALEDDDGQIVFDVEFYDGEKEYDYNVDAYTGVIYSKKATPLKKKYRSESSDKNEGASSAEKSNNNNGKNNDTDSKTNDSNSNTKNANRKTNIDSDYDKDATNYIGVEKARSIALKDAGVDADDVVFEKSKLDHDDRIPVYEIEFNYGYMEYEYEISAINGEILEKDIDD